MIYKKSTLNFMPKDLRFHPIYNKRNYVIFAAALFVATFGGFNFSVQHKIEEKRSAYRSIASINTDLNEKIQSITHNSPEQLTAKDAAVRQALEDKIYWAEAFKELSMVVPRDVWLTEFTSTMVDGKRVMSISGQSGSSKKTTDFFDALEKSYFFRDVQIKFTEKLVDYSPDLFRFKFECNVAEQKIVGAK